MQEETQEEGDVLIQTSYLLNNLLPGVLALVFQAFPTFSFGTVKCSNFTHELLRKNNQGLNSWDVALFEQSKRNPVLSGNTIADTSYNSAFWQIKEGDVIFKYGTYTKYKYVGYRKISKPEAAEILNFIASFSVQWAMEAKLSGDSVLEIGQMWESLGSQGPYHKRQQVEVSTKGVVSLKN